MHGYVKLYYNLRPIYNLWENRLWSESILVINKSFFCPWIIIAKNKTTTTTTTTTTKTLNNSVIIFHQKHLGTELAIKDVLLLNKLRPFFIRLSSIWWSTALKLVISKSEPVSIVLRRCDFKSLTLYGYVIMVTWPNLGK